MRNIKRHMFRRGLSGFMTLVMLASVLMAGALPVLAGSEPKIVFILGTEGNIPTVKAAYAETLKTYTYKVCPFGATEAKNPEILSAIKEEVKTADLVIMQMLGEQSRDTIQGVMENLQDSCEVQATQSSDFSKEYPRIKTTMDAALKEYFSYGGPENMKRLLLYLAKYKGMTITESADMLKPVNPFPRGAYHPDAKALPFDGDVLYELAVTGYGDMPEASESAVLASAYYSAVYERYNKAKSVKVETVDIETAEVVDEEKSSDSLKPAEEIKPDAVPSPAEESVKPEAVPMADEIEGTVSPAASETPTASSALEIKESIDKGSMEAIQNTSAGESAADALKPAETEETAGPVKSENSSAVPPENNLQEPLPAKNSETTLTEGVTTGLKEALEAQKPEALDGGNPATTTEAAVNAGMNTEDRMLYSILSMAANGTENSGEQWQEAYGAFLEAASLPDMLKARLAGTTDKTAARITVDSAWHAAFSRAMTTEQRDRLAADMNTAVLEAYGFSAMSDETLKGVRDTCDRWTKSLNVPASFPYEGCFKYRETYMAWYRASGKAKEAGPWIGVANHDTFLKNDDKVMQEALIESLEAKGANVILTYCDTDRSALTSEFYFVGEKGQEERKIDALVAGITFFYISGKPEESVKLFRAMDVPILSPVYSSDLNAWEKSITAFQSQINYAVAQPEVDGRIEPILMGGAYTEPHPETGIKSEKRFPLPYNIERLAGRTMTWAKLKRADNSDKKVAIIYYNHDGGKDGVGASYLNVTKSTERTLDALSAEGYNTGESMDAEDLEAMMLQQGRNVGNWAPGELKKLVEGGALTLPVDQYLEWYEKLPVKLKNDIEKDWGAPPGNTMVYNGQIVIPGKRLSENLYLGPQPMRGWMEDTSKIQHSETLSPPHQYVAYYLWLQNTFKADAVIHMGTHGTLEWLPGHSVALGENDWPDQLIGNMVNINPYIVNNPGEATQAKRRGYAVTISHMIPPMQKPELYGDLEKLQSLIIQYGKDVQDGNSDRIELEKTEIKAIAKVMGLDKALKLNMEGDFSAVAERIHTHLESLTEELMPYGLHTLGEFPEGDVRNRMVEAVVSYDEANRSGQKSAYSDALGQCSEEMSALLRALKGGFVAPKPGRDPIRVPEVMPTGANIISFDSREVPDKAAWEIGKKAADQTVAAYRATHDGKCPESMGVVLWAIETMRTRGESVAMIMRFIGVEPVYDKSNRVTSVKVIPTAELGRPRIDVVVTISGLFRDTFPNTVEVLDDAFRKVAKLNETEQDNYLKKHRDAFYNKLVEGGKTQEEADFLAGARIFGDAPGTYGTGVSTKGEATDSWQDSKELLDTYMNHMAYIYGKGVSGTYSLEGFENALSHVDAVVQIRDSIYGTLDNDDVAQYLGGLLMAAKKASGGEVEAYIANTRKPGDNMVQTLKEFVSIELYSRVLNPKWIEGMMKEGAPGAREIAKHVANMFLMDATTEVISDADWSKLVNTLVGNPELLKQLDPYALQSILGWAAEASRRQMWEGTPEEMAKLADAYINSAVEYGVVCCHHTCANLKLDEYVAEFSTLDNKKVNQFKQAFKDATHKDLDIKIKSEPVPTNPPAPVTPPVEPVPPAVSAEKEKADTAEKNPVDIATVESERTPTSDTTVPDQQKVQAVSKDSVKTSMKEVQQNVSAGTRGNDAVADKAKAAEQPTKSSEKPNKGKVAKAFEIVQSAAARSNAVSLIAVALGLVIAGIMGIGYMRKTVAIRRK